MRAEGAVALCVFFACLGVFTANPMFPRLNRPEVFRGNWGEAFFGVVTLVVLLAGLWTLVRAFLNITWYVNILLIIGTLVVSSNLIRIFPAWFTNSALAPIVAAIGLVVTHSVHWQ